MDLNELELFALEQLFSGKERFCDAVRAGLDRARVFEREFTGVGFFSTIRFASSLPPSERNQWDWSFSHSALSHGGSLMAWREGADGIGLEGVTHAGRAWPTIFDASAFVGESR